MVHLWILGDCNLYSGRTSAPRDRTYDRSYGNFEKTFSHPLSHLPSLNDQKKNLLHGIKCFITVDKSTSVHLFHMELFMCARYTSRERYKRAENGFPSARRSWRTFWQHGYACSDTLNVARLKCIAVKDTYRMSETFWSCHVTYETRRKNKEATVCWPIRPRSAFRVTHRTLAFKIARCFREGGISKQLYDGKK